MFFKSTRGGFRRTYIRFSLLNILNLFLIVSSLALAAFYYFHPDSSVYFIAIKDIALYIFLLLSILLFGIPKGAKKYIMLILPLMVIISIKFVLSDANLVATLASIRQMLNLYIIIFISYLLINNFRDEQLFYKSQLLILICVLIFGAYEWSTELWGNGVLEGYFKIKKIPTTESGYPFFFLEPIGLMKEFVNGDVIIRMTSVYLDPINFGHSLVFWFFLIKNKKNLVNNHSLRNLLLLFILSALLLTFSKGAWLQLLIIIFVFNLVKDKYIRIILLLMILLLINYLSNFHSGVATHLVGLANALESISLFGYGLGETGNYASMFSLQKEIMIGDTYIGALLGQIGLIGLLAWVYPIVFILKTIGRNGETIGVKIIYAQLFVSLVSENAFNLLSILNVSLLIGIELRSKSSEKVYFIQNNHGK